MKILLIKLPEIRAPGMKTTFVPPIGLWSIRQAARDRGHTCDVVDMHLGNHIPTRGQYDIVGISAQFSQQDYLYRNTAAICRSLFPDAEIVAGGFHAAAVPPPAGVDRVCTGEGEQFLFPNAGPTCPRPTVDEMGAYWLRGSPHDLWSKTDSWMTIETSRGCDRACGFCGVGKFWGRWRPLPGTIEYLKYLKDIGIKELFIEDDNLMGGARFDTLLPHLNEFVWSTPNGVEILPFVDRVKEMTNCWRVSLPFETGSPHTARLMEIGNKWWNFLDAEVAVERIEDEGIQTCGFFIIGYPGESLDDIHQTLEYANSLPLDDRHIYIATPYPGTPLYEMCKKNGWLRYDGPELYEKLQYTVGLIDTPEWSAEDIVEIRNKDREAALDKRETEANKGT